MKDSQLVDLFQRSRREDNVAVVEGVQALKHTARFKAELETIATCDIKLLKEYLAELAPDISQMILENTQVVDEAVFKKLSPQPPRTKVIAVAQRRKYRLGSINPAKIIVFLEDPRDLENIGAVIRVSAAADIGAVVISGPVDIWHPAVIRGAAGLHYALPVLTGSLQTIAHNRKLFALDPTGETFKDKQLPDNAVLIFGTERHGISQKTLESADQILRLPMKEGVSSLNLATSVAATLYMM